MVLVFEFTQDRGTDPGNDHHDDGHDTAEDHGGTRATQQACAEAALELPELIGRIDEHRIDRAYPSAHFLGSSELEYRSAYYHANTIQHTGNEQRDK